MKAPWKCLTAMKYEERGNTKHNRRHGEVTLYFARQEEE
jgi:hypothetical protein